MTKTKQELLRDIEFAIAKNGAMWREAEKSKDRQKEMYCLGKANAYSEMQVTLSKHKSI